MRKRRSQAIVIRRVLSGMHLIQDVDQQIMHLACQFIDIKLHGRCREILLQFQDKPLLGRVIDRIFGETARIVMRIFQTKALADP